MKNEIKIMAGPQNISDEELERFRNFDALLSKHYRILNDKKTGVWKVIVPAIVLIGSAVFYWMINDYKSKPVESNLSIPDSTMVRDRVIQESIPAEQKEPEKRMGNVAKPEKPDVVKTDTQPAKAADEQKTDTVKTSEAAAPPITQTTPVPVSPSKPQTVYVQAEPVDGYEVLYAYFAKEIIYPQEAVKDSIQGVLTVTFLINRQGKPEKIKTSGSLGKAFEAEAIRLIENMPLWKPATLNGQPVTSKLSIPLTFQLQKK